MEKLETRETVCVDAGGDGEDLTKTEKTTGD